MGITCNWCATGTIYVFGGRMKYLILTLFTCVSFAQEYYINIIDVTLDQMEIQIEHDNCVDSFRVDKNVKDIQQLAKDLVKKLKKNHDKNN